MYLPQPSILGRLLGAMAAKLTSSPSSFFQPQASAWSQPTYRFQLRVTSLYSLSAARMTSPWKSQAWASSFTIMLSPVGHQGGGQHTVRHNRHPALTWCPLGLFYGAEAVVDAGLQNRQGATAEALVLQLLDRGVLKLLHRHARPDQAVNHLPLTAHLAGRLGEGDLAIRPAIAACAIAVGGS